MTTITFEHLPEDHPMYGPWKVPCEFDGKRLKIRVREETPGALVPMLIAVGAANEDGSLRRHVNIFPVPRPVITEAVMGEPVTEMRSTWDWPRDEDGQPLLDEEGERLPKVETGNMVEVVVEPAPVITPAVVDEREHKDILMWGDRVKALYYSSDPQMEWANGLPAWQVWSVMWVLQGSASGTQNANEEWKDLSGVSAIFPDSISSPSHVFL